MDLKDRTVIVTGASSGLGKAIAICFAQKGANLVLTARREDKLKELCDFINSFNKNCIYIVTDVTKEQDIINMFNKAESKFGKIDILINNAGKGLKQKVEDVSINEWMDLINTNVTSVFLCIREAVRRMKIQNYGHIITVSSIAGLYGIPPYSVYCATKHAVTGFKRVMFWELKKYNIKVSTIYPARINTEFFELYNEKPKASQMLSPVDIAEHVVAIAERKPIKIYLIFIRNIIKRFLKVIIS